MAKRVLVVEDSAEIQTVVRRTLAPQYDVVSALTLKEAREALNGDGTFDLFVLDIELPDGDGMRFCAELKNTERFADIPVFVLTGRHSIQEKTLGFQLGIEDFISKPFEPLELKLRIDSRLKKLGAQQMKSDCFSVGDLDFNLASRSVEIRGGTTATRIDLSSKEFGILVFLAKMHDQVKSREQIISQVWGDNVHVGDRTVDAHISRIRKKILSSSVKIEAVSQAGYCLSVAQTLKAAG